jgi:hypothetical protein
MSTTSRAVHGGMRRVLHCAVFTLVAAVPILGQLEGPDADVSRALGVCLAIPFSLGVGFVAWVVDGILTAGRTEARPPRTF